MNRFRPNMLLVGLIFPLFLLAVSGCGRSQDEHGSSLQIKGSDTMVNVGQAWAEAFMEKNPETSVAVTGGGSGTGIAAIMAGTCDIAQSSRNMTPEEMEKAKAGGHEVRETTVGMDGIAVIVHPSNPISELTIRQLADIFTGKVTNWNEFGGKDAPTLVLSRERNSGTHIFFLEHVLRGGKAKGPEEFASSDLMMPSNQAIVQEVESAPSAIGYVGIGYVTPKVKVLAIAKSDGDPAILPSIETVQDNSYPVARPLFFYTQSGAGEETQKFISFAVSPEGQDILKKLDFIPLKK